MLLNPHDIARRIQSRYAPGWLVWYGGQTREYWAAPLPWWIPKSRAQLLKGATPESLEAAIKTFEMLNPKPSHQPPSP
jgi:hypothetical protein